MTVNFWPSDLRINHNGCLSSFSVYFLIIFVIWYQYFTISEVSHRHKIKNCIEQFKYSVHFKLSINDGILTDLMN